VRHYRSNPELQLLHDWQSGACFQLANHTARRAVELADEGLDLASIARRLAGEHAAPLAQVTADVAALFDQLTPTNEGDYGNPEGHRYADRSRRPGHQPVPPA